MANDRHFAIGLRLLDPPQRQSSVSPPDFDPNTANSFCRDILPAVSRTFALSIRLLPGDLGAAVRCAYLVCRIADTIEDEATMSAEGKARLFDLLAAGFGSGESAAEFTVRRRSSPAMPRA